MFELKTSRRQDDTKLHSFATVVRVKINIVVFHSWPTVDNYASSDLGLKVILTGLSGVIRVFNTGCTSSPWYSNSKLTMIYNSKNKLRRQQIICFRLNYCTTTVRGMQWHSKGLGGRHWPRGSTSTINKKIRPVVFKLFMPRGHEPPNRVLTRRKTPRRKKSSNLHAYIHAYNSLLS